MEHFHKTLLFVWECLAYEVSTSRILRKCDRKHGPCRISWRAIWSQKIYLHFWNLAYSVVAWIYGTCIHTHTHTHTHSEYNSSNRLYRENACHGVAVEKMVLPALEHIPDTLSLGPEDISPIEEISFCSVSIQTHKRLIKCLTQHLELNSYYSILCFLIFS